MVILVAKYLSGGKSNLDLLETCDRVLRAYQAGDKSPVLHGVEFESASALGSCQKNVREAVEATAFGKEWSWGQASCCATATEQRLREAGYPRVSLADAQPGDLCYMTPCGSICRKGCKQDAGHVVILHHQVNGVWWGWQNTSYNHLTLCCIPLRDDQKSRIVGVYRLFPLAAQALAVPAGELKINWRGEWLDPDDVDLKEDAGDHWVRLRAIAEAQGDVVKVDAASGKVYVGPAGWWA